MVVSDHHRDFSLVEATNMDYPKTFSRRNIGAPNMAQQPNEPTSNNYVGSILPAAFKENLKKNPEVFDQSEEAVTKAVNDGIKQSQAVHALNDAKRAKALTKEDHRREFLAQRKEYVRLRENVKACEIRINDKSFAIREWSTQLNNLIAQKKSATAELRLGDERSLEQQIRQVESDIEQTKIDLDKLRDNQKLALRDFRGFDREPLRQLAEELGETLPPLDKI
jgi:hypothetical protein